MPGRVPVFSQIQALENCSNRFDQHLPVRISATMASAVSGIFAEQLHRRHDFGLVIFLDGFSILFFRQRHGMVMAALDCKQNKILLRALLASFHILALSFTARRIISLDISRIFYILERDLRLELSRQTFIQRR